MKFVLVNPFHEAQLVLLTNDSVGSWRTAKWQKFGRRRKNNVDLLYATITGFELHDKFNNYWVFILDSIKWWYISADLLFRYYLH